MLFRIYPHGLNRPEVSQLVEFDRLMGRADAAPDNETAARLARYGMPAPAATRKGAL